MKGIAKEGVEHMGEESSQKLSLVYGEVDFFSFANILERAAPKQGEVFVDLGKSISHVVLLLSILNKAKRTWNWQGINMRGAFVWSTVKQVLRSRDCARVEQYFH